jgi:acyl-CoA thioester hydrolase
LKTTKNHTISKLTSRIEIPIRFSEIDALGIIWHGHYVKFFEDGREAFGDKYNISYLEIRRHNFLVPMVNLNVDFKKTVKYGDRVIVETTYMDSAAAKLMFQYKLFRASDQELIAKGETTQVFTDLRHELYITIPPFFEEWKKKYVY